MYIPPAWVMERKSRKLLRGILMHASLPPRLTSEASQVRFSEIGDYYAPFLWLSFKPGMFLSLIARCLGHTCAFPNWVLFLL
jgi:hypothetical protein